uniref:ZM domain-containing protein n=1 Tax=Anopheles dirus TaxID=7168 RepID=A0A182NH39_9DIPT
MAAAYQYRGSPAFIHFAQRNENYDEAQIDYQPYRTTPLVLPGAKVPKKDTLPTESYLRHHPNPAMRAPPAHDYTDTLMKQKVVHKQFNSPIGLYSDNNIENTIRQSAPQQTQTVPIFIDLSFLKQKQQILDEQRRLEQERQLHRQYPFQSYASTSSGRVSRQQTLSPPPPVPPLPDAYQLVVDPVHHSQPYKKTVVFDPCKSETYRALQEGTGEGLQEVPNPIQPKTFAPNRLVPGKKPNANHPAPQPEFAYRVNSMGEPNEKIHQSGSFKRLMLHVMSDMD